ncbi:LysR family transcriptional regulator [Bradyrhizobium sp. Tv2a-2]|uniref:LysR family transcriptional regulator n=1 Tax=Bradyrhizobium sp. Tv2a-2 TaxID=113395 RepID=UPI0004672E5E|nr:LysR family transcriptional regulator [Bradyrhizobium sp. Tv2a-2]
MAADLGSLRQAANASLVEQSTLSRSIRQLEHLVGIAIFERSGAGIRPTVAGRVFLRTARSILEQLDVLVTTTRASRRGGSGRLAVGFCTSLTAGNLRASLLEFRQRFPQVKLATAEQSQPSLETALRNGMLDVVVAAGNPPSLGNNKAMLLWSERILVIFQENHPLDPRTTIYWTDLRDCTFLLSQYHLGRDLEDLLTAKLAGPLIEYHDVGRGAIKSLISMGLGISLVLESDLGANFPGLVYREVRDGAGPSRIEFSARWRPDNENPALKAFINLLSERYPQPS